MATKKISQLTAATVSAGTEELLINDGGTSKKITIATATADKLPLAGGAMTGAITTNSTFDGVDVATRDAVLTSTTSTANNALSRSGGTVTGALSIIMADPVFTIRDTDTGGSTANSTLRLAESGGGATLGNYWDISQKSGVNLIFEQDGVERMRILSGGGLTFNGDTAAANALDDYEEGTWTPILGNATQDVAPANHSSVSTVGTYTKIGRVVTIQGRIRTTLLEDATATAVTGALRIKGLPFVHNNLASNHSALLIGAASGLAITGGTSVTGDTALNNTYVNLRIWETILGTNTLLDTDWTNDGEARFSLQYITDS